jgi:hypothetical protein
MIYPRDENLRTRFHSSYLFNTEGGKAEVILLLLVVLCVEVYASSLDSDVVVVCDFGAEDVVIRVILDTSSQQDEIFRTREGRSAELSNMTNIAQWGVNAMV